MICSKCQKGAINGKVKEGDFVCDKCLKNEKLKKEELVIRYATSSSWKFNEIKIVSAKYKAGGKYWIRKQFDIGWPYGEREVMNYRNDNAPGYSSPQEVVDYIYRNGIRDIDHAEFNLANAKKRLIKIEDFIKANGYKTPELVK